MRSTVVLFVGSSSFPMPGELGRSDPENRNLIAVDFRPVSRSCPFLWDSYGHDHEGHLRLLRPMISLWMLKIECWHWVQDVFGVPEPPMRKLCI